MTSWFTLVTQWIASRWRAANRDDRGLTVENAVLIAVGTAAAVALGTAIMLFITQAQASWDLFD